MEVKAPKQRLYYLDWLRVIAIGLLILFHIGMVYVPEWGFHFKVEADDYWLQNAMLLLSPWRMGLLWFISGVALRFMWHKYQLLNLIWLRSLAILLPLLIGVLLIVPPQLYIEMKQAGDMPLSFFSFVNALYFEPRNYFENYQSGIWPRFDVNHLWFLRSLWQFSLVLLLFSPILLSVYFQQIYGYLSKNNLVLSALSFVIVLLIETLLVGEQKREIYGFYFLLLGFVIGNSNDFWSSISRSTKWLVLAAVISLLGLQLIFSFIWQADTLEGDKIAGGFAMVIDVLAKVLPVFAVLSLGYKFLNRRSVTITLLNQWVFPIYVLHQTFIIMVAYLTSSLGVAIGVNVIMTLLGTFILCFISIKIMQSITVIGVFLGEKNTHIDHWSNASYWRHFVSLLCLPLALELVL